MTPVSGHRPRLLLPMQGLVAPGGVQSERPQQLSVFGHDPDVEARDEHQDSRAGMSPAHLDVVQTRVVAKRHGSAGVDPVATQPIGSRDHRATRGRLRSGRVSLGGRSPPDRAVRPDLVVVGAERIELGLQLRQRCCRILLGEVALERLVEPLDLAAGLGVIGPGVDVFDPQLVALELQGAASTSGSRGEHRTVIGQQRRREPLGRSGFVEARHHVGSLEHAKGIGAHQEPGVVIDRVQDLDVGARGELPVSNVFLPAFVRHLGREPDRGGLRSFLRLGGDEATTRQDPPDRGHRRWCDPATIQVVGDRVGACIQPLVVQFLAKRDDRVFGRIGDPSWVRPGPPGPGQKTGVPFAPVSLDQLVDPLAGKPIVAGHLRLGPSFHQNRRDHQSSQRLRHRSTPWLGCQRCRETPVNYVVKPNTSATAEVQPVACAQPPRRAWAGFRWFPEANEWLFS